MKPHVLQKTKEKISIQIPTNFFVLKLESYYWLKHASDSSTFSIKLNNFSFNEYFLYYNLEKKSKFSIFCITLRKFNKMLICYFHLPENAIVCFV